MVTKIKSNKKILYTSIGLFILILAVLIPLGFATGTDSATTYFDSTKSSAGGQYLKEAIDQMNYYCSKNCPKGKVCKGNTPKCRRATTLHTETCSNTSNSSDYCAGAGYSSGAIITYGNTSTQEGVLTTGDALHCDVNGDGTFDATTERFYYVSDYYDTGTKNFNDKVAVLIYYSNVGGGIANNTKTTPYDCTGKNNNGPVNAREQLPTTSQWSNIRLYKETRQILAQDNATATFGGTLPTAFSYAGYSARLLTYQELYNGCYSYDKNTTETGGLDAKCQFLMEGTKFSNNSLRVYGPWLESPLARDQGYVCYVNSLYRGERYVSTLNGDNGVRPTIEILKSEILY